MSTPGMKIAAEISAFCFEACDDQLLADGRPQHRQPRGEGRGVLAEAAGDRSGDRLDREALPGGTARVRRRARTAPIAASVTATIGTPAREAARSRSSSGGADPDEHRRSLRPAPRRRRRPRRLRRSSRASSGTSSRAPATRGGRGSPTPRRSSRTVARATATGSSFFTRPASRVDGRPAHVDRLQDPERQEVRDHRRAADRDERQRDAGDRRDPHRHRAVHEHLEQEHERDRRPRRRRSRGRARSSRS